MPSQNDPIYLDYAATTPLDSLVLEAMRPYQTMVYGNPSSLHQTGKIANKVLKHARNQVAALLNCSDHEIHFTRSGTESDNLAILGVAKALKDKGKHIITSAIEHPAVLNACKHLETEGWEVTYLPVTPEGFITAQSLDNAIRPDTVLVSIMHANNETGVLQDLHKLIKVTKDKEILFHTDAVQTVGKLPVDLLTLPVDYLTSSGHKIYGPKGTGVLFVRDGAPKPQPLMFGGGQEDDLCPGTENLAGIVGLARALEIAVGQMEHDNAHIKRLHHYFLEQLIDVTSANKIQFEINSPTDLTRCVPGIINVSFPPYGGESLVLSFDLTGIAVSSGSACHSATLKPSHVIKALGKTDGIAASTVRFSIGRNTQREEIDTVFEKLPKIILRLSRTQTAKTPNLVNA